MRLIEEEILYKLTLFFNKMSFDSLDEMYFQAHLIFGSNGYEYVNYLLNNHYKWVRV